MGIDSFLEPASSGHPVNCSVLHFRIGLIAQPGLLPLGDNREYCYAAYLHFIYWQHGSLCQGTRLDIPSCWVWRIMDTFPDLQGQYTDFIPSLWVFFQTLWNFHTVPQVFTHQDKMHQGKAWNMWIKWGVKEYQYNYHYYFCHIFFIIVFLSLFLQIYFAIKSFHEYIHITHNSYLCN